MSESTHQPDIGVFGANWLGRNKDIYVSGSTQKYFNTVTERPPGSCFNCGEFHWRKDCPRSLYHTGTTVRSHKRKLYFFGDPVDDLNQN
jgi:hypothetical protein